MEARGTERVLNGQESIRGKYVGGVKVESVW
jgi:hypothetical protein